MNDFSTIWEFPNVSNNEPFLIDAIKHKVKKDEQLLRDIFPKYYSKYLNGKEESFPTKGKSNNINELEKFKWDLVNTTLIMNNFLHPKILPSNKIILLPNLDFKDLSSGNCNYANIKKMQIGLWIANSYNPRTKKITDTVKKEIIIRKENEWQELMKKEKLDDELELTYKTIGFIALSTYLDKDLDIPIDCNSNGFKFYRRPNLLEIRNLFNAFLFKDVDIPSHIGELNYISKSFPALFQITGDFLNKYVQIFIEVDSNRYVGYEGSNEIPSMFTREKIKALADESSFFMSRDALSKALIEGAFTSLIKGIIVLISLDSNYFNPDLSPLNKKKLIEIRNELTMKGHNMIDSSFKVFNITLNVYEEAIKVRESNIEKSFDLIVSSLPKLKVDKILKPILKTWVRPIIISFVKQISSYNDYNSQIDNFKEELKNKMNFWVNKKVINKTTFETILNSISYSDSNK